MAPRLFASPMLVASMAVLACGWPVWARQQSSSGDYSREPYVVEHSAVKVVFDADGTETRDIEKRVHVQSTAALQQAGTVVVPYSRELATVDFKYVRSRKPDGSVVDTPLSSAIDLPADVTRLAPTYTDIYLKQIVVKGLAVGDTLECAMSIRTRSLIPGQFSDEHEWISEGIVLAEDFEVSVPSSVRAKVKTIGDPQPTVETRGGMVTYRWHHANLTSPSEKEMALREFARRDQAADVLVSSFQSWADVGTAIRDLWRDRVLVTPGIRAKALELTRDLKTDEEKLAAIYAFVSTKIRYVAVSFGVGRIQPHPAAEVLENGFGDCKDKSTLLIALLSAVGITAEPALIGPGVPVDPDVPSIDPFNHVITSAVLDRKQTWMDTTLEVAPLGLLIASERDANVLLMPDRGTARLVKTPAAPSRPSSWHTESVGTVSDRGALDATVHETISGDLEVLFRAAFRTVPQSQWAEAAKKLPLPTRFSGTVSDLVVSPPEDTSTPLQISYRLTADSYSDWSSRQLEALVPYINYSQLPGADDPAVPIPLGGPVDFESRSRLTLPDGLAAVLTADSQPDVLLDQEFARYHLENRIDGRVFETHREMQYKQKEIAPSQLAAYRQFVGAFTAASYEVNLRAIGWAWTDRASVEWYAGETAETRTILQDAASAEKRGDHQGAEAALTDLTRAKPDSDKAWMMLAWVAQDTGRRDEGVAILRKRLATAPAPDSVKLLASWLPADQALDVWRQGWQKFGKQDDEFALYYGEALVDAEKYGDAVTVLQTQADRQAKSSRFQWDLGRALLGADQRDAGIVALRHAADLDPRPLILNNVAWEFATRSIELDEALSLATRAVSAVEEEASRLTLTNVDATALGLMASLGAYWDTLAWTQFKLGHLDLAERYQLAAWDLMLEQTYASHESEIASARHDAEASSLYAEIAAALQNPDGSAGVREVGAILERNGAKPAAAAIRQASSLRVPRGEANGNAQAYVLAGPDGRIIDVAFISGDAALRPQVEALKDRTLSVRLPPNTAARLLRRGALSCDAGAADCRFTLYPARGAAMMRQ